MLGAFFILGMVITGPLSQPVVQPPGCVIRATGVGHPPPGMTGGRARLMARRAAEVWAVRNLVTKLGCRGRATIRGFHYAATTYRADGSVEVVVEYVVNASATGCCTTGVDRGGKRLHASRWCPPDRPPAYDSS